MQLLGVSRTRVNFVMSITVLTGPTDMESKNGYEMETKRPQTARTIIKRIVNGNRIDSFRADPV